MKRGHGPLPRLVARMLWEVDGLSARLVAEHVGVPIGTVRYWARRHGWQPGQHRGDASADRGDGYRAMIGVPKDRPRLGPREPQALARRRRAQAGNGASHAPSTGTECTSSN